MKEFRYSFTIPYQHRVRPPNDHVLFRLSTLLDISYITRLKSTAHDTRDHILLIVNIIDHMSMHTKEHLYLYYMFCEYQANLKI
jgi:hypothetical protein